MRPTGVAALDRLSQELLAAAPALRVTVATTPDEQEATYRLRYRQVVDHGWVGSEALRAGLERDAYDDAALHLGAWDGEALVGTLRLVLPSTERPLPVEAGRLVIDPAHRGDPAHRAWGALFARGWLSLRAEGFAVLAGAASPRMVERLRAVGLPFEILGPARRHWGEHRHPVRLDPARGRPGWF